ncbi:NAD(P)-dependent oxidoreductase [Oricola thermophila]|uniref:NAD(P)-dependent oxidoreductase n=1 Tax=Oricola thermophila TaxID=2742145 RepID=A0A6N1VA62_9HYPH|nr:NAD(P)-dependent oxidoreductase [Oricola thermophila]QKV17891.1 NAD(P)-dependent oxidoreductase [Oricola thermophila]
MHIAFIGFGEAARAFVSSLKPLGIGRFTAYDIKQGTAEADPVEAAAAELGVALAEGPVAAIEGADWVIAAVTAASSLEAAQSVEGGLKAGQVYVDINSVSARRKQDTAALVRARGAAYLDMAVMAPVHPRGHRTPVLVAGDHGGAVAEALSRLDFDFRVAGDEVGAATSIKMIRSLFVKGLEAITVQAISAAREAGCFDEVYKSLSGSYKVLGWPEFAEYQFERMMRHGVRRAAEMRESANSMRELGFANGGALADAIASLHDEVGSLGCSVPEGGDLGAIADTVLAARREKG